MRISTRRLIPLLHGFMIVALLTPLWAPAGTRVALAAPASVTIAGSLQSEAGCAGDWDPACAVTHLTYDAGDDVWQGTWALPAGSYEYKAALNNAWTENYGANAAPGGANIPLSLAAGASVKFYYDDKSHWVTSNANSFIAVVPGSFQSELGCAGDWDPSCLRSWLQDADGDGTYTLVTTSLPAGSYEGKVALNEGWDVNYGQGGAQNGPNYAFTVPANAKVTFNWNSATKALDIAVQDNTIVALVGSLQSEIGCAGDWDPSCAASRLTLEAADDVYQGTFALPAGSYEFKVALNNSWDVNYGANGAPGGPNLGLNLSAPASVKFYFDPKSHWITSNRTSVIAVAPGSFQSELGCAGDWDPSCLRSWLQDVDGDGVYTLETTALPVGTYEGKIAINESWDENYGQGGAPGGANLVFSVPYAGAKVIFTYTAATHVLTILAGHFADNNVEWDGLRHDSRDPLYRTPGGAVPAGTPVTLRFRTFHNDVTGVKVRFYSVNRSGQQVVPMSLAAADVSCYQAGLEAHTCDFWQATLPGGDPDNYWYRFIISDGADTDYYADNTGALDGGLGAASDDPVDNSFALMVYEPAFQAPAWAQDAVIYQIFPDRFRDGNTRNNLPTGYVRYDDPVLALPWGTLPEGFCRNYAGADGASCPWRFDTTPPDWSPLKEGPRGRDYMGGDLAGVTQKLTYLKSLGVTAIYFNPIFDGGSNHGYDTQNYLAIDPAFGTLRDFQRLVQQAEGLGLRVILDGVFNHLSSDSPLFDRYGHYASVGACESLSSPYRAWFTFHDVAVGTGACTDSQGRPNSASYDGWFGFDSIPVINKSLPAVQQYFLTGPGSVATYWLDQGAGGWRMDVSGDPSFPNGYWESFRTATKAAEPEALLISETWQKDSTLLRMLRGDRLDTTMNYRLRDAVIGFLTPQANWDSKGFADSGRIISASEFAARVASIREDYPDAAYYSLMNLLDSHDTERILWALTPGADSQAGRELNAANLAEGKRRLQLASLIQFTMPGAPTLYYGDEVGLTGDDDPDDRRTYPWPDKGGVVDGALLKHYRTLGQLRPQFPSLTAGDLRLLLADDAAGVVAYGRQAGDDAALVAVNRSTVSRTVSIPVAGFLPNGVRLTSFYCVGITTNFTVRVRNGVVSVTLPPLSGMLLLTGFDHADLTPPAAPAGLSVAGERDGQVDLNWAAVPGAAGYNVYRSPLSGGGFAKVNAAPLAGLSFTDTGLQNARQYYYVVRALDAAGNESGASGEAAAMPHLVIGWANLQWPPTMNHTVSAVNRTPTAYGQVWIDGRTNQGGATPTLRA
ncbi:MAG: hypothetical protein JNK29_18455, partial [Anaerolineales bacterium]|nr:hypothetical protein [Anaerolineales bacterium]